MFFTPKTQAGKLPDGRDIPVGKKICPQCDGHGKKAIYGKCSKCWGNGYV